ncbi:hypothetical protein [Nonomuraea glycinis]|uniref:hypothetical protein n=1 Tax=Nonomuraea glycinis TaxID=2047744 RepID=UPI00389AA1FE
MAGLPRWWSPRPAAGVTQQLVVGGNRRQRSAIGGERGQPPLGQRDHPAGAALIGGGPIGLLSWWLSFGCPACFQCNSVGGQSPSTQGSGNPGDDLLMGHVPVQQQHFDQRAGAGRVAVRSPGRLPPRLMHRGELARRPGLHQRGRARQGAWFAQQALQVVIQI